MHLEQRAQQMSPSEVAALLASHRSLSESHEKLEGEVAELKRQLDWFKKQLFGTKSERRLIDDSPDQLSLGEGLRPADQAVAPAQPVAGYTRRRPAKPNDDTASGLKFDETVPVEVVELDDPETAGLPAAAIEVIGEKVSFRLAQQRGDYVILKYVRKVTKRKDTGAISCPPAPAGVLEKSHADVSFLAGLVIDKLQYHLPLYRQHQRLAHSGIEVSRPWLTQLVHKTAALLEPVYEAQLDSIRDSAVVAMDETPIKASRKSRGKMKTTYYWPLYGEQDEVAFAWFSSRAERQGVARGFFRHLAVGRLLGVRKLRGPGPRHRTRPVLGSRPQTLLRGRERRAQARRRGTREHRRVVSRGKGDRRGRA